MEFDEWWSSNGLVEQDMLMKCAAKHLWNDAQKAKSSNGLQVGVYYDEGDPAFICRVNGRATVGVLSDIEAQINDDVDASLLKGNGVYLFDVGYIEAQRGEYGRIELAGYFDLTLIEFTEVNHGTA